MQTMRFISQWLLHNADNQHYLFRSNDLCVLAKDLSDPAFKTLLSRMVSSGLLVRLCRGLYLFEKALPSDGLLLFHAAEMLRADKFNYISLETVLSEAGVISQMPLNWITIMSSGRSNQISLGKFGTIEYVHTNQTPSELTKQLTYDQRCGMWRASIKQALRDMKATHRNCDLIDWDIAHEFI